MLTFILTSSIFNACSAAGNAAEPCAVKSTCAGTLKLGSNKLAVSGENFYYTFESENDGVYSLSAALVSAYKNTGDITSGEPLSPLFAVVGSFAYANYNTSRLYWIFILISIIIF